MSTDRVVPRWARWTVAPLLVMVSLGYLYLSAQQSRDSGEDKQASAAVVGLTDGRPSKATRHIYDVPIPDAAKAVAHFETNSMSTSSLYVRFKATSGGLDSFLGKSGTSRADLAEGDVAVTAEQARTVGWKFTAGRDWAGVSLTSPGATPDRNIAVDLTDPDSPRVYMVSTVNF